MVLWLLCLLLWEPLLLLLLLLLLCFILSLLELLLLLLLLWCGLLCSFLLDPEKDTLIWSNDVW